MLRGCGRCFYRRRGPVLERSRRLALVMVARSLRSGDWFAAPWMDGAQRRTVMRTHGTTRSKCWNVLRRLQPQSGSSGQVVPHDHPPHRRRRPPHRRVAGRRRRRAGPPAPAAAAGGVRARPAAVAAAGLPGGGAGRVLGPAQVHRPVVRRPARARRPGRREPPAARRLRATGRRQNEPHARRGGMVHPPPPRALRGAGRPGGGLLRRGDGHDAGPARRHRPAPAAAAPRAAGVGGEPERRACEWRRGRGSRLGAAVLGDHPGPQPRRAPTDAGRAGRRRKARAPRQPEHAGPDAGAAG